MEQKIEVALINLLQSSQYPSLSTADLAAYVYKFDEIKDKYNISLLTCNVANYKLNELLLALEERNPKIIGFSCYLWNLREYIDALPRIKEKHNDSIIIFGGPEVYPEILYDIPEISAVVLGEGELAFKEILERYMTGKKWENTRGIAYRLKDGIKVNPPQKLLEILDEIPSPFLTGLIERADVKRIEYSRGCKYRCSFCIGAETTYRHISIERVEEEIKDCILKKQKLQLGVGAFVNHKNFGVDVVKLIQRYRLQGHAITLIGNIFVDANNYCEEFSGILSEIIEEGSRVILGMGLQCCDIDTMRINRRANNFKTIRKNAALFKLLKLNFITDLLIGIPGDNLLRVAQSIVTAISLEPKYIPAGLLRHIPNTMIFREKEKLGIDADKLPPRAVLSTFSSDPLELKNTFLMAASFLNEYHATNYNVDNGRL